MKAYKRKYQNYFITPIPAQVLKRHFQRTFRKTSCNFYAAGCLLLCICIIFFNITAKHKIENVSNATYAQPQCRSLNLEDSGSHFQPLCSGLRLDNVSEHFDKNFQFKMPDLKAERKDWHDYVAMAREESCVGPGEYGEATKNFDEMKRELELQLIEENNFNALLSDIISVNRSVPNVKPDKCLKKQYLAKLPTVSIVISCRNEYASVLKRTLHSIVNRTPKELLKEIIIVDDYSSRGYNISQMLEYTESNFPHLVKFLRLPERMGLMYVRSTGAKIATADVLVFLDSHIECNHNWLPPLLEPIAINDRIATSPVIDRIDHTTFEYKASSGFRGGFTWELQYVMGKLSYGPDIDVTKPFKDPIMMGGLFAISRNFFWELGGYDVKLDTWGIEQFELSFKIWMCGGLLLVVPCSHVGHIFVVPYDNKMSPKDEHFMERNKKRVAEVWMDEYKHYVYSSYVDHFYSLDPGDLTEQHAVRQRLNCKPFKWFLDFVMPDVKSEHPYEYPPDFANGTLRSVAFDNFCLDNLHGMPPANVGLYPCAGNLRNPHLAQLWNFNVYQEVKNFFHEYCLDAFESAPNTPVKIYSCHRQRGNQFWYYDKDEKWLVHRENGTRCLEAIEMKNGVASVVINKCEKANRRMKWNWGFINENLEPVKYLKN